MGVEHCCVDNLVNKWQFDSKAFVANIEAQQVDSRAVDILFEN